MTRTHMLALSSLLLASCANVTFHPELPNGKTPDLSRQTGLKYYSAKPYLLVGPTGNKDAPLKAEIISLPDLENPTYAIYHPGWGQHIFSLAVSSNGSLSSYGQTADTKIPETIAAVGSLMSGVGALAAFKEALAGSSTPNESIRRAIKQLDDLQKLDAHADPVAQQKISDALTLKPQLENMIGNYTADGLAAVSQGIAKLKFQKPQGKLQSDVNEDLDNVEGSIDDAIDALNPASSKKVRLYEIKMRGGKTTLKEVKILSEDE